MSSSDAGPAAAHQAIHGILIFLIRRFQLPLQFVASVYGYIQLQFSALQFRLRRLRPLIIVSTLSRHHTDIRFLKLFKPILCFAQPLFVVLNFAREKALC